MNETQRLESLLAGGNGGTVTLARKDARELVQKLRARGEAGAAARLAHKLDTPGDVSLEPEEAQSLLEQLRESGRRWVFGSNDPRELPSMKAAEPAPEPELRPEPLPEPAPEPELQPEAEPEPLPEPEAELEPEPKAEPEPEPEPEPKPAPEPEPAAEPQQKQGFFRRLFGRTDE